MNTTYPNDILPFGVSGRVENGDVLTLEQYQTDPQRLVGHQPGIARQALENTALRQVSHMAAGLAQYIANRYPGGVRDDGDLDAVERGLLAAVASGLAWSKETDYAVPSLVVHGAKVYVAVAPSGPHASVGPQQPTAPASPYWKAVTPDTDGITIEAVDDALTVLAAPKLKTPRNIVLYGGATGAASFDGSADARIDVTSLDLGKGTGTLPVSRGGTGATTADAARQNLGIVLNNTVTSPSAVEFATAGAVKTAYDKALAAGVTLNNTVTSTSTTEAATANAVKTAYDKAVASGVTLNNTVTSTSTTEAATANAVKTAYDKAVSAQNAASSAQTVAYSRAPMPQSYGGVGQWVGLVDPWNGGADGKVVLPSGGTWVYVCFTAGNYGGQYGILNSSVLPTVGVASGGSSITIALAGTNGGVGFAWRIA